MKGRSSTALDRELRSMMPYDDLPDVARGDRFDPQRQQYAIAFAQLTNARARVYTELCAVGLIEGSARAADQIACDALAAEVVACQRSLVQPPAGAADAG